MQWWQHIPSPLEPVLVRDETKRATKSVCVHVNSPWTKTKELWDTKTADKKPIKFASLSWKYPAHALVNCLIPIASKHPVCRLSILSPKWITQSSFQIGKAKMNFARLHFPHFIFQESFIWSDEGHSFLCNMADLSLFSWLSSITFIFFSPNNSFNWPSFLSFFFNSCPRRLNPLG